MHVSFLLHLFGCRWGFVSALLSLVSYTIGISMQGDDSDGDGISLTGGGFSFAFFVCGAWRILRVEQCEMQLIISTKNTQNFGHLKKYTQKCQFKGLSHDPNDR